MNSEEQDLYEVGIHEACMQKAFATLCDAKRYASSPEHFDSDFVFAKSKIAEQFMELAEMWKWRNIIIPPHDCEED